jgi:hypothetical protein
MAVTISKAYFCSTEALLEAFVRVGNCVLGYMRGASSRTGHLKDGKV